MQLHKKLVLRIKIKETGFFTESVGCYQIFSQKPGFWLLVNTQETGFFAESVGCYQIFSQKPGF
jgi:hypothetical protein